MNRLKSGLVRILPAGAVDLYRRTRQRRSCAVGALSAPELITPYVAAVHELIDEHDLESVVDLGCGDFHVGKRLLREDFLYCGVDVFAPLVAHNAERHASPFATFRHADIVTDELPPAKLCLIRLVLQHLSNRQVAIVIERCQRYPFVVVTEHLPEAESSFLPNVDITPGYESRIEAGSGVVLDAPPFGIAVDRVLCDGVMADGTRLRTVLVRNDLPDRAPNATVG